MRKFLILVILVLVVTCVAMPVFAASAHMSVSVSKGTVTRGETITITISTSMVENCVSGGFHLNYNNEVFEYAGGSALVGGFAAAGVTDMAGSVSGYFMSASGGVTVQGTLFQIFLRVRDDAPYGSYSISGTPSMTVLNGEEKESVGCSAGGAVVTVACNHNYGSWTNLDDNQHGKTCSVCGGTEKEDHAWGNDVVLKEATCKDGGKLQQTCGVCGATQTVDTDPNNDHSYEPWTNANDTQHTRVCSVCKKEDTVDHEWDAGKVTKEPNCKEGGQTVQTCPLCSATRTIDTDPIDIHKFDNGCDKDCNICGLTRETTHQYKTVWSKDKTDHWHECSSCKHKTDVEAHIPGDAATTTKPQTCIICGYVIKAALGHKHSYETQWTTDEKGHWYICSGCEEKGSYADHDFENDCDTDCSVCAYTRETEHTFDAAWAVNANDHWHECTGCGLKQDEESHIPGAEATETTAQVCIICDYEIEPALGVEETTPPTNGADATTPLEEPNDATVTVILWCIGAAIVVAAAGVIVVAPKKKKK